MWVFLPDAMISIIAPEPASDSLVVRARVKGDLERLFPAAAVWEHAGSDYRYRAYLPRAEVTTALAERCKRISYGSLLNAVTDYERAHEYDYCRIALRAWQKKAARDELVRRAKDANLRDKFGDPDPGEDEE